MRKVTKILIAFVLSSFLCVSLFAQNKIAVIDTRAFDVEEQGITELIVANKTLAKEFESPQKELKSLNDKLLKFIIEADRCSRVQCIRSVEEADKMILEAENLSKRIKAITDEITPQIEKRKVEIIEPINKRIAEKLKKFAKQKGYETISEDLNKQGCVCESGVCISYVDYPNVTNEFIKFCNEEFEKEKTQKQ